MRTNLEVPRILERLARFIPEEPGVVGLAGGELVGGAIHSDSFTLRWSGGEWDRLVNGHIRDRGDQRLVRLVVDRMPLQRWAAVGGTVAAALALGLFLGGVLAATGQWSRQTASSQTMLSAAAEHHALPICGPIPPAGRR
jgi:hypothetical protein